VRPQKEHVDGVKDKGGTLASRLVSYVTCLLNKDFFELRDFQAKVLNTMLKVVIRGLFLKPRLSI